MHARMKGDRPVLPAQKANICASPYTSRTQSQCRDLDSERQTPQHDHMFQSRIQSITVVRNPSRFRNPVPKSEQSKVILGAASRRSGQCRAEENMTTAIHRVHHNVHNCTYPPAPSYVDSIRVRFTSRAWASPCACRRCPAQVARRAPVDPPRRAPRPP